MTKHDRAHDNAESKFKKREMQLIDGQKAMAEHEASRLALYTKSAKLKELRLARDAALAAEAASKPAPVPVAKTRAPRQPRPKSTKP